jgi:hypothetical protein
VNTIINRLAICTIAVGLLSLPLSSLAQDSDAGIIAEGESSNMFVLAPYLWAVAIDGTSGVGSLPPVDIDADFGDILDNANFAASLHTEFLYGNWTFVLDPTYISLEMEAEVPPVPLPEAQVPKVEVDVWLVELWAGYKVTANWELIGGLRYQDQDLSASNLPSPPLPVDSGNGGDDFTDWFLGARFKTNLGEKWFMTWRGDVRVAGDSESSINTSLFFNRRIGRSMALNLGYKYLVHDYDDPGVYRWDVTQSGPVIGYTWTF